MSVVRARVLGDQMGAGTGSMVASKRARERERDREEEEKTDREGEETGGKREEDRSAAAG